MNTTAPLISPPPPTFLDCQPTVPSAQPAHAAEHARLVEALTSMCQCPIWGLPGPLCRSATLAINRLQQTAQEWTAFPTGWELVKLIDPALHEDLVAFDACAALQDMDGVLEPGRQRWSRTRCHDALRTLRSLSAHQNRVALDSYAHPWSPRNYVPPGLEPMGTSPGIGLCLPH